MVPLVPSRRVSLPGGKLPNTPQYHLYNHYAKPAAMFQPASDKSSVLPEGCTRTQRSGGGCGNVATTAPLAPRAESIAIRKLGPRVM
jgi:hypothetical protein